MNEKQIAQVVTAVIKEQPLTKKMTLKLAVRLIDKIERKAQEMRIAVVIAVCDEGANPVAVHSMDGAYIGSYDIAVSKTFTSVGFKMSTKQLGDLSQPGESLYGIQFTNGGKVVIFGGGEPLYHNHSLIGGLGVSGGNAVQDTDLAAYGESEFRKMINNQE